MCVCVCTGLWSPPTGDISVTLYQTGDVLKTGRVPTLRVSAIECKSNVEYVHKWQQFVCTRNVPGYQWTVILVHKASPIACCTSVLRPRLHVQSTLPKSNSHLSRIIAKSKVHSSPLYIILFLTPHKSNFLYVEAISSVPTNLTYIRQSWLVHVHVCGLYTLCVIPSAVGRDYKCVCYCVLCPLLGMVVCSQLIMEPLRSGDIPALKKQKCVN